MKEHQLEEVEDDIQSAVALTYKLKGNRPLYTYTNPVAFKAPSS